MTTISSAPGTASSLADQLARFVELWPGGSQDQERLTPSTEFNDLREGLKTIAEAAQASDQNGLARALYRLALLIEIWECLESEPDQREAAAEVADFCLGAIGRLARSQLTDGRDGDLVVCDEILRQSNERWGDYVDSVDPACAGPPVEPDLELFEQAELPQDDAPPELDQATLLRLLQGTGSDRDQAASDEILAEKPDGSESREGPAVEATRPLDAERTPRVPAQPSPTILVSPRVAPSAAKETETPREPGLDIPPLPRRLDLDDEMREAFLEDATDLFERIERIVIGLGSLNDHREAVHELGRCFHTLKGAAGSVGLIELAALVHQLEDRLGQAGVSISPGLTDQLHKVVNYLEELIGWLRRGPTAAPEAIAPRDQDRVCVTAAVSVHETTAIPPPLERPAAKPAAAVPPGTHSSGPSTVGAPEIARPATTAPVSAAEGPIRVPAARFDELTDLASELIVQGRFWLSQAESVKTFATTVQDCRNRLLGSLDRLHDVDLWEKGQRPVAAGNPDADFPVQLRRLEEQIDDLAVLAASARAAAAPMADRGDALVRLSRRIWDSFQSLRIVPIQGLFQRLARVVHDAARVEGRQVEVVMKGEETGVDRAVQDKAFEPLLHVVRNAVGHGIEAPADRVRAGKPATGCITIEARREGNTLVIVVGDDGKGLDDEAIAAKARQLGWLGPDERPGPERLHGFLFQPGFSTRSQANSISGRGVGMDVVAREVENLRGTLDLVSQPGRGTQLTIRLPARLALEPALIVRVAGQPFAVPATQVEHAQLFESAISGPDAAVGGSGSDPPLPSPGVASATYRDRTIPVVFAREMLGIGQPSSAPWTKLVIVRSTNQLVGLVVDAIERAEDLVIKPLGALLAGHPLVSGTSTSINGEVISVLHSSGLERWLHYRMASGAHSLAPSEKVPILVAATERMTVLVVDDSISVRRGAARQLRGLGLQVQEVSDGLEALGRLRDCHYDLVLTDLEMPKLDGFALLAEIKRSARLSTIPVIVASTRSDPETRRRVLELGAQALLAKPVDPLELVRVVEPLLPAIRG
jgi:chemotaxis protein histidine kinase CheA